MSIAETIETLALISATGADPRHPSETTADVVTRRMWDAQRGQPGSSMGGGGGQGGSPVERAVTQPDIGGDALRQWRRAERQAHDAAQTLLRLAQAWSPKPPSPKAIRETAQANVQLCEHCRNGTLRADAPTDVRGNLADPLRLCRWCYDQTITLGRLPDARMVERHRKGQRIRIDAS